MNRRIALLTHYLGNEGGGVASVVSEIALQVGQHHNVRVFGLSDSKFKFHSPSDVKWGKYGLDTTLHSNLLAWKPDLIHLHGLFTFVSYSALKFCKFTNIPVVVSPHGMLDPWALNNSRIKKKLFLSFIEKSVLNSAAKIHVLNYAEQMAINHIVSKKVQIKIIPNGIAVPAAVKRKADCYHFNLLYLGRLHPKKGLSELLYSLHILMRNRPHLMHALQVNIVGWGDRKYENQLKSLTKSLELCEYVHFRGPAFGSDKAEYFSSADAFILPSFSEGLPMAILEAWSYAVPVMATSECNLPEGFENRAAIRIHTDPSLLALSLAEVLETPRERLHAIGMRGLELVGRKFSWGAVTRHYLDLYEEVLEEHEARKLSK